MPLFDKPLAELREYRPDRNEPADFDRFWRETLDKAETDPLDPVFTPYDAGLSLVDVWDVRFTGFGGHRIAGWFLAPREATGPLPTVVQFLGYQGGRMWPIDWLMWPAAGYALLVMDTRGKEPRRPTPIPARTPGTGVPHPRTDRPGLVLLPARVHRRVPGNGRGAESFRRGSNATGCLRRQSRRGDGPGRRRVA